MGHRRAHAGLHACGAEFRTGACGSWARSASTPRNSVSGLRDGSLARIARGSTAISSACRHRDDGRRELVRLRGAKRVVLVLHEHRAIAYGKNEVQDFGDLLVRAQRDNGKVLVRDGTRRQCSF